MTITRLWQSGMESNRWSASISEFDARSSAYVTSSSVAAKSGSYSLLCNYAGVCYATKTVPATKQIRSGFHVKNVSISHTVNPGYWAAYTSGSRLIYIKQNNSATEMALVVNGSTMDTCTYALPQSDFRHIGVDLNSDSGSGWAVVYIDGEEGMRYEGNLIGSNITSVVFGHNGPEGIEAYYDDMFIDDTTGEAAPAPVPDRRFVFLSASDNGTYSQGLGSDGNSASNYLLIDDYPHDGDTTYISVSAADIKETYNLSTYTAPSGFLFAAVIPVAYAKKLDAEIGTGLGMLIRTGGSDSESASQSLPTSYGYTWSRFTAKPDSASWAQADIDDLESGYAGAGVF